MILTHTAPTASLSDALYAESEAVSFRTDPLALNHGDWNEPSVTSDTRATTRMYEIDGDSYHGTSTVAWKESEPFSEVRGDDVVMLLENIHADALGLLENNHADALMLSVAPPLTVGCSPSLPSCVRIVEI